MVTHQNKVSLGLEKEGQDVVSERTLLFQLSLLGPLIDTHLGEGQGRDEVGENARQMSIGEGKPK